MNKSIILAAAPNGAYKQKADHPALPINDDELITFAQQAETVGISMLHLHIRDKNLQHSIDAQHYQRLLSSLQQETKLVVQVTSESAGVFSVDDQIEMIRKLKPAFVSIAWREISRASNNDIKSLFAFMRDHNISPQIILYSEEDALQYIKAIKQLSADAFPVLFVAGRYQAENSLSLLPTIEMISATNDYVSSWMLCGFEFLEHQSLWLALALQGDIRIGFENNLHTSEGEIVADNLELLKKARQIIESADYKLADKSATIKKLTPHWK